MAKVVFNAIRSLSRNTSFVGKQCKLKTEIGCSSPTASSQISVSSKGLKTAICITTCAAGVLLYWRLQKNTFCEAHDEEIEIPKADNSKAKYDHAISQSRDILQRIKDEHGVPGIAIGVSVNGKTVWMDGIGYADIENRVPCTPNTVMRIASISKSITMTGVAKLWEDGKLDLDKPVQYYVPEFPTKTFDGEKVQITCRHLIAHTSGIRHYDKGVIIKDSSGEVKTSEKAKVDRKISQEKKTEAAKRPEEFELKEYYIKDKYTDVVSALNLFKDDPLVCKPGSRFYYSTHGYTLVSAIVEKASQEPFDVYITKLFKKLGMNHTFLDMNDVLIYHRSRNYIKDKKKGHLINAPYVDNSYKWAGGGILSTVGDLLQFGNTMLYSLQFQPTNSSTSPTDQHGKAQSVNQPVLQQNKLPGFLQSKTVGIMWTPICDIKNRDYKYAMGWAVLPESRECEFCEKQSFYASHTGEAVGGSSILLIYPEQCNSSSATQCKWDSPPRGVIVAILCNLQEVSFKKVALQISELFMNPGINYHSSI